MKTLTLLLIAPIVFGSCNKEESTNYSATMENKTTHKIQIKPYTGGVVNTSKILTLLAGEKREIANGTEPGLSNGGFISPYFLGGDSLVVVYDDTYSIVHYGTPPIILAPKHHLMSSPRHCANWRNYALTTNKISKHKRENIHYFAFIEQDYLDAR